MEIVAYRSYAGKDFSINFRRTKSGIEVDFVLGKGEIAIEIKESSHVYKRDIYGLNAFTEAFSPKKVFLSVTKKKKGYMVK